MVKIEKHPAFGRIIYEELFTKKPLQKFEAALIFLEYY